MADLSRGATATVHLAVPARPRFLRLLRVTAASAAAEGAGPHRQLDDVRLAVGELAAAAVDAARPGATLHVDVRLTGDGVEAHGRVLAGRQHACLTELATLLLGTVAHEHRIGREGDEIVFDLRVERVRPSCPRGGTTTER